MGGINPLNMFQSTPPRGRRLKEIQRLAEGFEVSIHASAREATDHITGRPPDYDVSIHASAREATNKSRRSTR